MQILAKKLINATQNLTIKWKIVHFRLKYRPIPDKKID